MKKVLNLIKNKVLINTFKKSNFKNFLLKRVFKKKTFYLLKFKNKTPCVCFLKTQLYVYNTVSKSFLKTKNCNVFSVLNLVAFLLKYMFIKLYKPTTNTLRFKKNIFMVKFKTLFKKFKFFLKNNAGRNNYGGVTVFSKGKKERNLCVVSGFNLWDKYNTVAFSIFRNKNKFCLLQKHTTGSLSVVPYIQGVYLNQKLFSTNLPQKYWNNTLPGNCVLLKFLERYTVFSNVTTFSKKIYALSNGTFCQTVDYILDFNLSKIILPSKNCVYLSGFSFVLVGSNPLQQKKFCISGKAGVNKIKGLKPKVRGVARNPVDHPHGGRTKTNQPEVSIWGWVAKKNK